MTRLAPVRSAPEGYTAANLESARIIASNPAKYPGADAEVSGAGDREGPTDSGRAVVLRKEGMTYRSFLSDTPGSQESGSGVGSGTATAASVSARQSDAAAAGARMAGTAGLRGWPDPLELLDDGQVPRFPGPPRCLPAGLFGQRCLGFNLYVYSHMV
jgi:hypothetical protein